jgi:hypothetical protein
VSGFKTGDRVVVVPPGPTSELPHIRRWIEEGRIAKVVEVDGDLITVEFPVRAGEQYELQSFTSYGATWLRPAVVSKGPLDQGERACATCRFCATVALPQSTKHVCQYRVPAPARKYSGYSEHGDKITVEWHGEGGVFVEPTDWCHAWELTLQRFQGDP